MISDAFISVPNALSIEKSTSVRVSVIVVLILGSDKMIKSLIFPFSGENNIVKRYLQMDISFTYIHTVMRASLFSREMALHAFVLI